MKHAQQTFLGQAAPGLRYWFMRQAGRYLPEYRALRQHAGSFLDLCMNPAWACEVSLQPIRRFDCDVIIMFSDILVIPHALGQSVTFLEGEGPCLQPLASCELSFKNFEHKLQPVFETLGLIKNSDFSSKTIMGFSGAPWTLLAYMLEGKTSRTFDQAFAFALTKSSDFEKLMNLLVEAVTRYCHLQIEAGADAIQLFDTWAGLVPAPFIHAWVIEPTRRIVDALKKRHPKIPVVGFPKGLGLHLVEYARGTGVDALSLDSTVPLTWAKTHLQPFVVTQGNLDPHVLLCGGADLDRQLDVLATIDPQRHVFNLGHGILPTTPVAHVERCVQRIQVLNAQR